MTLFDAKDPDDIDDFTLDWSRRIASGESIATVAATVLAGGVTVESTAITEAKTTVRVSGGTAGQRAQIRERVTFTPSGRRLDETIEFAITEA